MTSTAPPTAIDARAALRDLFGYPDFKPGQEPVIEAVLAGEDVLAVMPTGAGKSLCYQLPAFLQPGCTVVISPLVALMKDQLDSLPPVLREQAAVFNSTIPREQLDAQTADLVAGRLKLVYVAPERLRQRPFLHALGRARIGRFVVDEAHCISLWGHDFRPDYLFIPDVLSLLGAPPLLAMTATATPRLETELRGRFSRPLEVIRTGVVRPNLYLEVERVENKEEKLRRLIEICTAEQGSGIIYVSSRENAETIARVLRQHGINANHYHAGLESGERARVQDWYMSGRTRVIVATVAFGMGVDKADVRFIVHFNPSRSLEAYAQEAGRAGRDGRPARCILFWASSDKAALSKWLREDALSRDTLSAVWRALRQGQRGRYAWWPADQLVAATRATATVKQDEIDETTVRVALGALEQVGIVRRHCDLPELAQIRLSAHGDAARVLAGALDAAPGNRLARETFEVADALGCEPSEVEERLLTLEDEGALAYYGTGRGLLVEILPQPADLSERLRDLLAGYERAQQQRVAEIEAYATTERRCRTATIARHFGEAHSGRCEHCDVCVPRALSGRDFDDPAVERPARQAAAPPEHAPEDIILACIAELPFQMGKSGLVKVLKGSVGAAVREDRSRHFGALAALPASQIEREMDQMVEAGYLGREPRTGRDGREYFVLSVTPDGFAKPPAPWPPPRPAAVLRATSRRAATERAPTLEPAEWEDDSLVEERFAALKEWRREQLRGTTLPAYTVFNDETLRLLAARRIASLEDIARVKGVGRAKLEKYGAELLELLAEEPDTA